MLEIRRHAVENSTLLAAIAQDFETKSLDEQERFKYLETYLADVQISNRYVIDGVDELRDHRIVFEEDKILVWLSPLDFAS